MPATLLDPRPPAGAPPVPAKPPGVVGRRPPRWAGRAIRSLGVSAATTVLSLTVLAALTTAGMGAARANVLATLSGIGPSYSWNRRFAWRRSGRSHPRLVAVFWGMCVTALVASTAAVAWAERTVRAAGGRGVVATGAILAANVTTFGVLWVVQFVLLDRVVFRARRPLSDTSGRAA